MHFAKIFLFSALLGLSAADCTHDNCLRAVIASAFPTREAAVDCSSYMKITVTPATSTVTAQATVTQTITIANKRKRLANRVVQPRQVTVSPSSIPAYASACSGSVRYSSACSCIGITAVTITAATPLTTVTQTTTVTATINHNPSIQINNFEDFSCNSPVNNQPHVNINSGQCYALPLVPIPDFSNSWGSFDGGSCAIAASACTVVFYTDLDCFSFGETDSASSSKCVDASNYFSLKLICPSCP